MAKHSRKPILAIILTLCAALCLGIFAACNDDGNTTPTDQPVTYTVTIMQDATTPAEGVRVTVKKGNVEFDDPKTTNANGKVTFELVPDDYTIVLEELPDHYESPAGLVLNKTNRDVTFTLARKPVYKISLVNPDGTPYYAEDVYVGVCDDSSCRSPIAINAQGVAEIEEETGDYHVQIQGLPAGYAYSWVPSAAGDVNYYRTSEGIFDFTVEEGNRELTIVIYPVTRISSYTPMTDDEKDSYGNTYIPSGAVAYKVNVTIPAGETVYYSMTSEHISKYKLLYITYSSHLTWLNYGAAFNNNGEQRFPVMEANKTHYFGITNTDDENEIEVEFVIEAPTASYHEITSAQSVSAGIDNENAYAVIEFKPTAAAAYKATARGDQTAIKEVSYEMLNYASFENGDYQKNDAYEIRFTSDMIGKTVYLVASVKNDKYPAAFTVELEKLNDLEDTITVVESKEELKKFDDQTGMELIPIALDGSETIYYDEDGGYYRLGDGENPKNDDPIVVVMLTKNLDPDRLKLNQGGSLVYLEMTTAGQIAPYVFDVTEEEDKESLEKGNSYVDYRAMLRGFAEYDKTPNIQGGYTLSIPEEIEGESYYAKYVNGDGVYPLNKELEEYLKRFAEYAESYRINNRGQELIPDDVENWMFACYYYGVEVVLTDDIIGEYEDEEGNTLTVKSNGKYTITYSYDGYTESGRWSKIENEGDEAEFYLFKGAGASAGIYDVERKDDGTLEFCYNENDYMYDPFNPFDVVLTFSVPDPNKAQPLYTLTTQNMNGVSAKLVLFDDNTFKLSTGMFGFELLLDGTYNMQGENITINVVNKYDEDLTNVTATYEDGVIVVTLTYTYEAEEEGEEDMVISLEYKFDMDEAV